MGALRSRVGSKAICKNQPMPILIKSEFSLDPVYPRVSNEGGVPIGASTTVWETAPPQSYPGYENINQVIFQEQQCCLRF
jgi:conjugal transfer pilus assembly protein TraU